MTLRPNSELVTVAWIKGITGIPSSSVGTTLPGDNTTWATSGFVQVGVAGGTPDIDLPVARPVMDVRCWAVNPGSARPPWGKANQLAEIIRAACYHPQDDDDPTQRTVTLPAGYQQARVLCAYWVTEPRRIPGDEARYACYGGDLAVHWVAIP